MQPDDQEAAIMADEDLITTSAIEVLRSDLNEMSAKISEKVVCVRSRH